MVKRTPIGVGGRTAGRAIHVNVNEHTGNVIATFEGGAVRRYSMEEIADHVAQLAEDIIERPDKVSEPWHEFLRGVVGADVLAQAIAMVAMVKPLPAPATLRTRFDTPESSGIARMRKFDD